MKKCFKCGECKPLSEYYKHGGMSDGHINKCKSCTKKDVTENRRKNLDYYRTYDRERGSRQDAEDVRRYREKFPKKYKAHSLVNNAIRNGSLEKQPCEVCGCTNSVAHHDDYDKPLEVRWLCQVHHLEWHKENGEGLNGF